MIEITLERLKELCETAVAAGIQKYEQGLHPDYDIVCKNEAERFLRRNGVRPTMLQAWTDAGLLTPVKDGEKRNSRVNYSLADIKNAMFVAELKRACN